jgi:hypothetical protein
MLACTRTSVLRAPMSVKVFFPQDVVDSWINADKVELSGEVLTFRGPALVVRLVPGFCFTQVAGGSDEGHQLLGRVKSRAAVAALGAEVYMNSVILGETAYEVEAGFIAKPLDSGCARQVLVAALAEAGY